MDVGLTSWKQHRAAYHQESKDPADMLQSPKRVHCPTQCLEAFLKLLSGMYRRTPLVFEETTRIAVIASAETLVSIWESVASERCWVVETDVGFDAGAAIPATFLTPQRTISTRGVIQ